MAENLRELWRFRDLLRQLVRRELKVRYKNSVLGFVWSIVPPLLQVLVYTFFIKNIGVKVVSGGAFMLCALIPWTFITTATLDSSQSLLVYFPIIKKVYLPREVIPLAIVISNFIHLLMGWLVFFVFYLIVMPHIPGKGGGIPLKASMLWFPMITFVAVVFVTGLALWASALNVFYDDVKFILKTSFNLLLLLLPVFYPSDVIFYNKHFRAHPWMYKLYMLNPPTAIMEAYRKTLLQPIHRGDYGLDAHFTPLYMNWPTFIGASAICIIICWSGYTYFNHRKWQFVERP